MSNWLYITPGVFMAKTLKLILIQIKYLICNKFPWLKHVHRHVCFNYRVTVEPFLKDQPFCQLKLLATDSGLLFRNI